MGAVPLQKVLVVDDSPDLRAVVKLTLAGEFSVFEAADGREALEKARKQRPRLILLDVDMPQMGGVEALDSLRANDPAVIVIMLTGERDIAVAKRALELGASAFVTKPFDPDFLRTEVRRLLARAPGPAEDGDRPWRTSGAP